MNIWEAFKGVNDSRIARELMPVPIRNDILELAQIPIIQKSLPTLTVPNQITPLFRFFAYDSCTAWKHEIVHLAKMCDHHCRQLVWRRSVVRRRMSYGLPGCLFLYVLQSAFTARCADYLFEYDLSRQKAKEIANTRFNEVDRASHSSTMISGVNLSKVLSKILPCLHQPSTLPRFAPHDTALKC